MTIPDLFKEETTGRKQVPSPKAGSSTRRPAASSSDELLAWHTSGRSVEDYLDVFIRDVSHDFAEMSAASSRTDADSGRVVVDMTALYVSANDYAADYVDLFDKYVCLKLGLEYADSTYRYKAFDCMQIAFAILAVGLGAEPEMNTTRLIIQAWKGVLTVS